MAASYFLAFLGAGVYLPYLPLYLAHLGWSVALIGAVTGAQPLLRWLSAIAWTWVADRWGLRHRLLVACALGGAAAYVPLLFARAPGAVALTLATASVLHGPLLPMLDATVLDHLAGLGGDYGRLRLWGSAAFIGGAIASAPLVAAGSPAVIPLLLLLPSLGLAPVLLGLPRHQRGRPEHSRPPWRLLTPPLGVFLAAIFLLHVSSGAWNGFFAVYSARLGFSDAVPGVTWGLTVTAEIALFHWGRRVLDWIPAPRLIVVVVLVTAARWALTACAEREVTIVALQLGHAITFSASHLAAQVLLARLVSPESTTGGQALYGLAGFGCGGSAGIAIAGLLLDRLGARGLFGVEALVALAALVPALRIQRLDARG